MNKPVKNVAVLFNSSPVNDDLFATFADKLLSGGAKVGGIVQEISSKTTGKDGKLGSIDAIEIDSGKRIPIKTPHLKSTPAGTCLLEISMLAECSSAITRALSGDFDIVVIEKFGRQEAKGEGLIDEIMAALISDTPAIIALPQSYQTEWNHMTGGDIEIIPPNINAMLEWWNK